MGRVNGEMKGGSLSLSAPLGMNFCKFITRKISNGLVGLCQMYGT